ncbi:hypothetical protein [Bradyrhizobium sp.]|uniref:hypothetical protein n=1 Tax=Bradyrhizobium sp. TaxID=376 RepID=UPI002D2565E1|nr:hypothetical protein [Bradyrhizobium sp.]HZR74514.1 hypothetical protein [Bradyrhizobium sp.]
MKMLSWSRYHTRPWLSACVVRRRDLAKPRAGRWYRRMMRRLRRKIEKLKRLWLD